MNKTQKAILSLDKIDPLHLAEEISGESYKDDEATMKIGFALHLQKGEYMRDLLSQVDDTQFSETVDNYLRIVTKFGFEIVYKEGFEYENRKEFLYVLFQKELGIVLKFDTWNTVHVNSGNFYYNWSPNKMNSGLTSSGGFYFHENKRDSHVGLFEKDLLTPYFIPDYPERPLWGDESHEDFKKRAYPIYAEQNRLMDKALAEGRRMLWVGDHDCREGIITKIKAMWENGKFFPKWHQCAFPWLCAYPEFKKGEDYKVHYEPTSQRIIKMPQYVQDCIGAYPR